MTLPVGDNGELRFTPDTATRAATISSLTMCSASRPMTCSMPRSNSHNEHIAFELFMKNIGDELYNVQMVTAAGQSALSAEPRTYGLNFKFKYSAAS